MSIDRTTNLRRIEDVYKTQIIFMHAYCQYSPIIMENPQLSRFRLNYERKRYHTFRRLFTFILIYCCLAHFTFFKQLF